MKKLTQPILFLTAILFLSCSQDFGTTTVTYEKATAIYGDLGQYRSVSLLSEARELVDPGKIFISETLLLIGEEGEGIHVYDNSDATNPIPLNFISIPGNHEFIVHESYVYAESYYDMLKIDVSNPLIPTIEDRVQNAFAQELVNAEGEILVGFDFETVTEELSHNDNIWNYLNNQQRPIAFFDFSDRLIPSSAVPSSFAGSSSQSLGTVNRIAFYNDFVYVIDLQRITSFSDAETLELANTTDAGWALETIYPVNDRLFIGTRNSMEIFSLSNPTSPSYEGSFRHATSCDPVLPLEKVAYVTLRTGSTQCQGNVNALVVLDISNSLFNPAQLEEIDMLSPYGMTMIGDKLYVGEGNHGLKIFDATDRQNIKLEKFDDSVEAYDVIQHPTLSNYLLITGPNGLGQYEIGDQSSLNLISWVAF